MARTIIETPGDAGPGPCCSYDVVIPVECLNDEFFQLKTRIAGELIQKFVQYRRQLVIVGDISRHLAESSALRAFVAESNRGKEVWFLASLDDLEQRLARTV